MIPNSFEKAFKVMHIKRACFSIEKESFNLFRLTNLNRPANTADTQVKESKFPR